MVNIQIGTFDVPAHQLQSMLTFVSKMMQQQTSFVVPGSTQCTTAFDDPIARWKQCNPTR